MQTPHTDPLDPHETIDPNETFIDAITNSRNEFVTFIDALPWDVKLRTQCESLLIMYDQMKQFIIAKTPPTTYGSTFMKMITMIKSWFILATSPWIDCGMYDRSGHVYLIQMKIKQSNNRKSFRRVNLGFLNSPGRYPQIFKSVMDINIKSDANPIS